MKVRASVPETIMQEEIWNELYPRIYRLIKKNWFAWQSVGAILGLGGGILSFFTGVLLTASSSFAMQISLKTNLYRTGIIFFVLILPFLTLGAHCLDLLEKKAPLLPPRI